MNFVGKPCAGKPHARFDEGGRRRIRLNLSLLYRRGNEGEKMRGENNGKLKM